MCSAHWFVYLLRCSDGSLFTGVSGAVEDAVRATNGGEGAVYTKSRLPVFLAHVEEYMNEIDANRRASAIKRLSRTGKERILVVEADPGALGAYAFGT